MRVAIFIMVSFILMAYQNEIKAQKKGSTSTESKSTSQTQKKQVENSTTKESIGRQKSTSNDKDSADYFLLVQKLDSINSATKAITFQASEPAILQESGTGMTQSEENKEMSGCEKVLFANEKQINTYLSAYKKRLAEVEADNNENPQLRLQKKSLLRKILELKITVNINRFACDCFNEKYPAE